MDASRAWPSIHDLTSEPNLWMCTSVHSPPIHPPTTTVPPLRLARAPPPSQSPMAALAGTLAPPLLPLRPPTPASLPHPTSLRPTPSSFLRLRSHRPAVARAASGGNGNGDGGPPAEGEKERQAPSLPKLSEIRWGELLSPEPSNAVAVVLTGALAWAGASLLLQVALISAAIVASAVKYSFVAALLLFVLIALL